MFMYNLLYWCYYGNYNGYFKIIMRNNIYFYIIQAIAVLSI